MSEKLYTTFGNDIKYRVTKDTLVAYLDNATIKFPLPEASADILADLAVSDNINPQQLEVVETKLVSIGFNRAKALTMATVLIQVAKAQGVDPLTYFEANEASLKLAIDTYTTINLLRPAGNRINVTSPIDNSKSRYSKLIKP